MSARADDPGWQVVDEVDRPSSGCISVVRCRDRDVVLYRTEHGVLRAVEPYCPHLGAHLGYRGCVIGERLQCRSHGWEWDLDGRNVRIPFSGEVSLRGRLRWWPVLEDAGVVALWADPDRDPPPADPLQATAQRGL